MSDAMLTRRILQDVGDYVMFLFEDESTGGDGSPKVPDAASNLPESWKDLLLDATKYFRGQRYLHAFDHYVVKSARKREEASKRLKKSMASAILFSSKELSHTGFLRECALYFMTASMLKDLGLEEAPDIALDAILQAAMKTSHCRDLIQNAAFVPTYEDITDSENKD